MLGEDQAVSHADILQRVETADDNVTALRASVDNLARQKDDLLVTVGGLNEKIEGQRQQQTMHYNELKSDNVKIMGMIEPFSKFLSDPDKAKHLWLQIEDGFNSRKETLSMLKRAVITVLAGAALLALWQGTIYFINHSQ